MLCTQVVPTRLNTPPSPAPLQRSGKEDRTPNANACTFRFVRPWACFPMDHDVPRDAWYTPLTDVSTGVDRGWVRTRCQTVRVAEGARSICVHVVPALA